MPAQWTKREVFVFTFTNGLQHTEGGTSLTGLRTAINAQYEEDIKLDLPAEMSELVGLCCHVKYQNPFFFGNQ